MLTERDVKLLRFMGNWSYMLVGQCQRYLGCSYEVARRRLKHLIDLGLVVAENPLMSRVNFYSVSKAGLEYLGFSMEGISPKGLKLAQLEHDRILVDIAIEFALEHPDYEIHGEMEMRRRDSAALARHEEPEFSLKRYSGGRFVNIFPDMVASKNGNNFYIEYEHTPKDKKRLASLMSSYANSFKVAAVKYYASPAAISHVKEVYGGIAGDLPLVGGKPKIQIEEYGQE